MRLSVDFRFHTQTGYILCDCLHLKTTVLNNPVNCLNDFDLRIELGVIFSALIKKKGGGKMKEIQL